MAESNPVLSEPVFTKIEQLRPWSSGHTLTVKVVNTKMVMHKDHRSYGPQPRRRMRINECLVGDETGMIIFIAFNDQVDLMQEGSTVILRNAKINMFNGSMRIVIDKWRGSVEITEPVGFTVKEDSNLSLLQFEWVDNFIQLLKEENPIPLQ